MCKQWLRPRLFDKSKTPGCVELKIGMTQGSIKGSNGGAKIFYAWYKVKIILPIELKHIGRNCFYGLRVLVSIITSLYRGLILFGVKSLIWENLKSKKKINMQELFSGEQSGP